MEAQDDRTLGVRERIRWLASILETESGFHFSYFNHVPGIQLALGDDFFAVDLHLGLAL
jgi:hypothetical protein